jgi:histone deacetylase 6
MTHMLSCLANGKLVLALEGGYNLDVIATSALECVKVLLGESPPQLGPMNASESATAVVYSVALEQSRYWKAIKPEAPEPKSELEKAVSTVPLSHILKAHRANYLYHTAGLVNTELADPDLQATFEDQVFCSENVYEAETLLLFVHDLGTVHAEIGAMNFDVHLEKTYMVRVPCALMPS